MTPETALVETVARAAAFARHYPDDASSAPWLVTSAVLAAQQAAALALRTAGDAIPAQAGATELMLRAAAKDRLPAPFTLPFGASARQSFDRLVEARNSFMHPRGLTWFVSRETLVRGLPIVTGAVRHLILIQPILDHLVSPAQQVQIQTDLEGIDALATFLTDPD